MNKYSLPAKYLLSLVLLSFTVSPVYALSTNGMDNSRNGREIGDTQKSEVSANVVSLKTKSCLARESEVKTRMTQLTKLVTTMETTFDKIAERVKLHYTTKIVPTGKVVANYSTLEAEISTKKEVVQTKLNMAEADIKGFDCNTGKAKVLMNKFRIDMQAVKVALGDYRKSVNNLIVAIKPVSVETERHSTSTTKNN